MLFQDFQDTFFDVCRSRRNSAGELAQKEMALRNHLLPFFGAFDMEAIGKPEVRAYVKAKLAEEYAEKTVNNHLLVLSRYLAVARDERALVSPRFAIEHIPLEFSEARFLTKAEIARLLLAAGGDAPIFRAFISFALHTGLRAGELLALDWAQVSLAQRTITVAYSLCRTSGERKAPKNNKHRPVALTEQAYAILEAMPSRTGNVFGLTYQRAYDAMERISAKAGLADVGLHTLRHTFASLLVMEGVPLLIVSRLLGHSSVRITERYAHLNNEHNKNAVAVLASAIGA